MSNSFFQLTGIICIKIGSFSTSGNSVSVRSLKTLRSFSKRAMAAGISDILLAGLCFIIAFILSNV